MTIDMFIQITARGANKCIEKQLHSAKAIINLNGHYHWGDVLLVVLEL